MKSDGVRAVRAAKTRERIVQAAAELFGRRGYVKVGIRDVAAAAGVSTGAVFAHFEDKEALFKAATGSAFPDITGFLRDLSCRAADGPIGELNDEAALLLEQLVGRQGIVAYEADAQAEAEAAAHG